MMMDPLWFYLMGSFHFHSFILKSSLWLELFVLFLLSIYHVEGSAQEAKVCDEIK